MLPWPKHNPENTLGNGQNHALSLNQPATT